MNTGVMLMNVKNLIDGKFKKFVISIGNNFLDRSAFVEGREKSFSIDMVGSIGFNWKPYWGDYSGAKIIHIHGSKPFQRTC
jgi:hypothetical protein